jgi:hypothetical protein
MNMKHDKAKYVAKNAADLEAGSEFWSAFRERREDISHKTSNCVCCNFKERKIA